MKRQRDRSTTETGLPEEGVSRGAERRRGFSPNSPVWIRTISTARPDSRLQLRAPHRITCLILSTHSTCEFSRYYPTTSDVHYSDILFGLYRGEPGFSLRMNSVIYLFGAFIAVLVFPPGMSVNLSWTYSSLILSCNIAAVIREFCWKGSFL